MLHKRAQNRDKGNTGEDIACKFLIAHGFTIVDDRNYQKKWGELDIVAKVADQKENSLHFFEVKSVVRNFSASSSSSFGLSYKPEDNVHNLKVRHLKKIIQTYLAEKGRAANRWIDRQMMERINAEFHFHILCVYMMKKLGRARVKSIKDVIL